MRSALSQFRKFLIAIKWSIETAIMLCIARFLIKFCPFKYWRSTLGNIDNEAPVIENGALNERRAKYVARWIRIVADRMPFNVICLPRAMACRWMLSRRGLASKIYIGTKRDTTQSGYAFHAWLHHGDLCLTGQSEKDEFIAFASKK